MKRTLLLLLAIGVLGWTAWQVNGGRPVQTDGVPEKYRDTIHKGLEYLAKNQQKDGHWEGDGGAHPVAMTGLVGLALLMEKANPTSRHLGEKPSPPKHAAEVRRAVDWLIGLSGDSREGLIYSGHESERSRYMQGHGLATILLSGVLRDETDATRQKKLNEIVRRAVKYIVQSQSSEGGWYDTSKMEGHDFDSIQATVIQIQAMQAAANAGFPVPDTVIRDGKAYLQAALEKAEKQTKPSGDGPRAIDAAAALAGAVSPPDLFARGRTPDDPWRQKWEKFCRDRIPTGESMQFGRDELAHCYFAEALVIAKSDDWARYRTALFDALQARQNKDGSWPAGDGISVGPVYSTAVWCVVLQLDKESHPSMRPELVDVATRTHSPLVDARFALNLPRESRSRLSMSRGSP
jgi:hypothetical protein